MSSIFIAAAIPVFFSLIFLEAMVAYRQGRSVYRFNDAVVDLSCGIGQQMTQVVWAAAVLGVYVAIYEWFAIFEMSSSSAWTWIFAVLAYDHQYYWWHRVAHRSRLFWTTHVVHHQSEDYNLAVALRQAWFSSWSSIPFYAVLAILGVPPVVYAIAAVTNTLYQFWIHTELVGKLGRLEWVLNTPSHHRVHHAVDPKYIDKNYAGFLIIWDRMYGTFVEEDTRPTYGTVKPHRSWNPVWANIGPLVALAQETRQLPTWPERIQYMLAPPEWRPESMGGVLEIPEPVKGRITWDARSIPNVHAYIAVHFVLVTITVTWTLATYGDWSMLARLAMAIGVIWTTAEWGGLLERRAWALPGELARLTVVAVVTAGATASGTLGGGTALLILALCIGSAVWLRGAGRPPVRATPVVA